MEISNYDKHLIEKVVFKIKKEESREIQTHILRDSSSNRRRRASPFGVRLNPFFSFLSS